MNVLYLYASMLNELYNRLYSKTAVYALVAVAFFVFTLDAVANGRPGDAAYGGGAVAASLSLAILNVARNAIARRQSLPHRG